ncbi:RNase H domain-containing protein [Trichonephila clavipes]|nr:RNase H domain-containing protein [Trichonephila clavipes]
MAHVALMWLWGTNIVTVIPLGSSRGFPLQPRPFSVRLSHIRYTQESSEGTSKYLPMIMRSKLVLKRGSTANSGASSPLYPSSRGLMEHLFQFTMVSSHVSLPGNEVADDLVKAAASDPVDPEYHMVLTSTENYFRAKELICRTWVIPPVHPWYFQRYPGSAISFKGFRSYQMAFSRFPTRHLRCMTFEGDERSFLICTKCDISPFSSQHVLQCLGFSCGKVVASPCSS